VPLLGGTVSNASRDLSHTLSLVTNLVVFGAIFAFVFNQSKRRMNRRTHFQRFGPTYLTALGALLVLADNVRHVLQDTGIWPPGPWPGSSQYRSDCPARMVSNTVRVCNQSSDCGPYDCGHGRFAPGPGLECFKCLQEGDFADLCTTLDESFACLSSVGWVFTVFMTYAGFGIFIGASLWNADVLQKVGKIQSKWHELRDMA